MNDLDFQKDVMRYLKNIVNKLIHLNSRVHQVEVQCAKLETIQMSGFRATGEAFHQTKTCVNALATLQEDTMDNLAECSGAIQDNTWHSS